MKTIHCPVCSQEVTILKNGRLKPHMHGAKHCVFSGQRAIQVESVNKLKDEHDKNAIELLNNISKINNMPKKRK